MIHQELTDSAKPVRRYLFGLCHDWHLADEISQQALLKAWEKRANYAGRAAVRTWLFTIAKNTWRDHLRRKKTAPKIDTLPPEDTAAETTPGPGQTASNSEFRLALNKALALLPDEQREALALREGGNITFKQASEILSLPIATVKSRVRYALEKLAAELKQFRHDLDE